MKQRQEMLIAAGQTAHSSWTDSSQQLQPLTVLFTDTLVTVTLMLIRGTLEVSAQPPAGFSLAVSPEAVLWFLVWPCFSDCLQTDI